MRARERERERERTRGRETAAKAEREEEVDLLLRGRTQPSRPWRVDTETAHPCPVLFCPASTPAVLVFCCPRFLQTFFSGILWSFSPCAILWSACLSMLSSHLLTVYVQAKFASIFFQPVLVSLCPHLLPQVSLSDCVIRLSYSYVAMWHSPECHRSRSSSSSCSTLPMPQFSSNWTCTLLSTSFSPDLSSSSSFFSLSSSVAMWHPLKCLLGNAVVAPS